MGRSAPTEAATIAGDAEFAATAEFRLWREKHNALFADYEAARFDAAAAAARVLADSVAAPWRGLYLVLEQRFSTLAALPVPPGWSPVWSLESK